MSVPQVNTIAQTFRNVSTQMAVTNVNVPTVTDSCGMSAPTSMSVLRSQASAASVTVKTSKVLTDATVEEDSSLIKRRQPVSTLTLSQLLHLNRRVAPILSWVAVVLKDSSLTSTCTEFTNVWTSTNVDRVCVDNHRARTPWEVTNAHAHLDSISKEDRAKIRTNATVRHARM